MGKATKPTKRRRPRRLQRNPGPEVASGDGKLDAVAPAPEPSSVLEGVAAPQRVAFAVKTLDGGARYGETKRRLMEKFTVCESTAERDIKMAYKAIAEEDTAEIPQMKARISAAQWRIAASAMRKGKFTAASVALGRLAKLHGLDAPTKVEVDGLSPDQLQLLKALSMTPAERQKRMAELEEQADEAPAAAAIASAAVDDFDFEVG